ncbi:MAG: replication restart DNA helicase PriA [Leptolyngbyaceae cyanobacterium bins.59]|nr:replication restart DNA helicase PriA [Leptolyngbyaceae cyanobacterium bins.59]
MQTVQTIRCSNCGSLAERHHLSQQKVVRTQCEVCDYLLVTCFLTGRVIEAHAPGTHARKLNQAYPIALTCEARS